MATQAPPTTVDMKDNTGKDGGETAQSSSEAKQKAAPTTMTSAAATPKNSSTPTDSILPVNMSNSMMTPNNRPPSRSSVASAGSSSGRTTTSRRGGRTRSRSPTAGHNIHLSTMQPYGAGRPSSTTPSVPSMVMGNSSVPPSPRAPSIVAAAAADAAKSLRDSNASVRTRGPPSSGMHQPGMHYPHQPQAPYGGPSGGTSSMRDPYGRQAPQGRQDPYSSRYPGGPPGGQRQTQRPPSSVPTSYPGQPPQQQQRPHSRSSAAYPQGPPPPGYYDSLNGNRNPSSSSHHPYHQQHPRSRTSSRTGPPPHGNRYDPQGPPPSIGSNGRPLSRNGGPSDPQNPYAYNHYRGAPSSSRGGMPPGNGRDYGSQYPGRSSSSSVSSGGRYGGPPGGAPGSNGPIETGEYGRQHHGTSSSGNSGHHGHTSPQPHHRHQYQGGPPPPTGHHTQTSSSRGGRQAYSSGSSQHHPSYRHGDPNGPPRGPPPSHYRGGPPPSHQAPHSSRGGPPPSHPDYHRYHAQTKQQHHKGGESMAKSTRTVMGTATPLHLNKGGPLASAPPQPGGLQPPKPNDGYHNSSSNNSKSTRRDPMPSSSRRGSAASVFRGRPGPSGGGPPQRNHQGGAAPSSSNPKTILDALDTPSNSFEEKKSSRGLGDSQQAKDSEQELSPENPPKLRNPSNNASASGNGAVDLVFDPQRSPKSQATGPAGLAMSPPQLTNSLDMAPSFSLFNQSFDSLGDTAQFFNVSGALDSAMLNSSTSFELKGTGSRSPSSSAENCLQLSSSNGTFKLNTSMSGFGMSPTNSFGNGPTASFSTNTPGGPGGSLTVLGGISDNGRSSSPSQVLDLYKSVGSIEEADLRLSASLCSPMIGASHSYSSSRPFATGVEGGPPQPSLSGGEYKSSSNSSSNRRSHLSPRPQRRYSGQGHHSYRPQRDSSAGPPNKDGSPRFYNFLRTNADAFSDVTFLLPELKAAMMKSKSSNKGVEKEEDINNDGFVSNENTPKRGQNSRNRGSRYDRMPTDAESETARRRIVSAVCAFGGTFIGSRMNNPTPAHNSSADVSTSNNKIGLSKSNSQSIFRGKNSEPATVTPNSSGSSSAIHDGSKVSPERAKYDGALPTRYYESDNRLSWEFEENPPIGPSKDGAQNFTWCQEIDNEDNERPIKMLKTSKGEDGTADDSDDDLAEEGDGSKKIKGEKGESPKMRYRCKLCGQPKTDHVCPYQQSLVRSIGAMVRPAVNAFTAAEPGQLAPDLKEMNNMAISAAAVAAENNASSSVTDIIPAARPTPDRSSIRASVSQIEGDVTTSAAQVTPESSRGQEHMLSPGARTLVVGTPVSSASSRRSGGSGTTPSSTLRKKRSHARMNNSGNAGDQADLLFVEEMELKSEQFRMVTPSKLVTENPDAFTYPALPLPYAQRKRLSDNLFSLSKEIPQLTDECAAVLREARERDLWDLAVAELMTQVVVVVHCQEGDNCFEGLSRYLLTLGFTC